jgi:hypothetical protein
MEKHINIVAALQIGLSILSILIGIFVFTILCLVGNFSDDAQAEQVLSVIAIILISFITICSIPGILAGAGLFKRKEWARILALIISVIHLINFPFGTAVGAYSIWALVQPEVAEKFKVG